MAKAPKKIVKTEEAAPEVQENPKVFTVILRGKGRHVIGINGYNTEFIGGTEITVAENIYLILKDADIIEKEI